MELIKFSESLYNKMEEKIKNINGSLSPGTKKLSDTLHAISIELNLLKNHISENGFAGESEEIDCFKNIYPKFYCWYIYVTEEFNILTNVPTGTDQMIRDYYLQELALIKRYFNQNQFSYQYFVHDETALDEDYFLRKNLLPYRLGFGIVPADGEFATNQGYNFARFRASEMLQEFIIKRIRLQYQLPENTLIAELLNNSNRRWTGEKINLIEIAYGIYYTGQMNEGKADIKEIIAWLESSLNVDLSQVYRMFIDIRRRKTSSYTKFLESMSAAIHQHIEETYNYKPKNKK